MEYLDLVRKNRSYRGFDSTFTVSRKTLESLVEFARLAPSSVNLQPLKYFLSYTNATNALIQPLTAWARRLQPLQLPKPGQYPTAFIVILQDLNISENIDRFAKDVGIVAQTMLLGATSMGLGGCMIGNFSPEKVREALSLAPHLQPVLILALGKPVETIVLDEAKDGEIAYWREEDGTHHVPKRPLEELIVRLERP